MNKPGMVSVIMREKNGICAGSYLFHFRSGKFFFVSSGKILAKVNDNLNSISFNNSDAAADLVGTVKDDSHSLIKVS